MLPNFLIIGAAKSGTTWLAKCLANHPGIYMAEKEVHYFSRFAEKPISWYESYFAKANNQPRVGERSNTYFGDRQALERIHSLIPKAKLVVILRNPWERAYSNFCMSFRNGTATEDIDRILNPDQQQHVNDNRILRQGLYFENLQHVYSIFPKSNVLTLFFEDLKSKPVAFLNDVCAFLDVESFKPDFILRGPENVRPNCAYPRLLAPLVSFAERIPVTHDIVGKMSPRVQQLIRQFLKRRPIPYPALSNELRERLVSFYAEDIRQLEILTSRDLSHWYK